jgi:predicted nucleic acid-binding protein
MSQKVRTTDLFLSAITVIEMEISVLRVERRDPRQVAILRAWIEGYVLLTFADRVLSVTNFVALRSARFHVPVPHSLRDGIIAATVLIHGMTVATRNVIHFESTGAAVFNPWLE